MTKIKFSSRISYGNSHKLHYFATSELLFIKFQLRQTLFQFFKTLKYFVLMLSAYFEEAKSFNEISNQLSILFIYLSWRQTLFQYIDVLCKINIFYLFSVSIIDQWTVYNSIALLISYYLTDKNFLNSIKKNTDKTGQWVLSKKSLVAINTYLRNMLTRQMPH